MDRFDLQPCLTGKLLELRPMRLEDWEALFAVASDPLIWEGHPARDRYQEERFREYFADALASGGALVAIDRATGEIIGASRYFWHEGELEIGWTFLARAYWGGAYNAEMKRLMLDHAFQFVERVIFLVDAGNVRSQRAMVKIGGTRTERRVQRSLNGKASEYVVFEVCRAKAVAERGSVGD